MFSGGPGPRGAMATMSQYMLSSAATFGFFMSIGSVSHFFSLNSCLEWRDGANGARNEKRENKTDDSGNQNRLTIPVTSRPNEDVTSKFPNCWSMEEEC
jgi:hypothetical protein